MVEEKLISQKVNVIKNKKTKYGNDSKIRFDDEKS